MSIQTSHTECLYKRPILNVYTNVSRHPKIYTLPGDGEPDRCAPLNIRITAIILDFRAGPINPLAGGGEAFEIAKRLLTPSLVKL